MAMSLFWASNSLSTFLVAFTVSFARRACSPKEICLALAPGPGSCEAEHKGLTVVDALFPESVGPLVAELFELLLHLLVAFSVLSWRKECKTR